jgi:O-antigen ligase
MKSDFTNNASRLGNGVLLTGMILVVLLAFASVVTVFLVPWYYAVIICSSVAILAAFFFWPEWGTYSLIFLIPFTTASVYFSIKADWNFIVGEKNIDLIPLFAVVVLFTFLGYALRRLIRVEKGTSGNIIACPVFVVLAYSGLTILWSDYLGHSIFQFLIFAMNVGIFVLITAYVKEEKHLAAAVWCFVASGILQALSYMVCFFLKPYILTYKIFPDFSFGLNIAGGYFQLSGMPLTDGGFMDHHQLALMTNLVLAVSLGLLLTKPSRLKKSFLAVSMAMFIFVVLHTQSRAGIGSLLVMVYFAFLAFHVTRKYWFRLYPIFVVGVLVLYFVEAAVIGAITGKYTTPRLLALGQKMATTQNVIDPGLKDLKMGRMKLWKKSFKKYKDYVIEGFGVGNLKKFMHAPHAHSVFLSFLFDFGIIGLSSIMFIVGALVKRFKVLLRYQTSYSQIMSIAFGAGLVAIGFHGQFDFEYNTTLLWLYLGLTVASFRISYQGICGTDSDVPGKSGNIAVTSS